MIIHNTCIYSTDNETCNNKRHSTLAMHLGVDSVTCIDRRQEHTA